MQADFQTVLSEACGMQIWMEWSAKLTPTASNMHLRYLYSLPLQIISVVTNRQDRSADIKLQGDQFSPLTI